VNVCGQVKEKCLTFGMEAGGLQDHFRRGERTRHSRGGNRFLFSQQKGEGGTDKRKQREVVRKEAGLGGGNRDPL